MKANLMSPPARKSCRLLEDVTLRTKTRDLFLQGCNLGQIGPHLPVPGKGCSRRRRQLPHPAPQNALGYIKVTRGLGHRHAPVRHQPYGLDLELTAELPSRQIHSPVPGSRSYLRVHETGGSSASRYLIPWLNREIVLQDCIPTVWDKSIKAAPRSSQRGAASSSLLAGARRQSSKTRPARFPRAA
jgi:hypothetical protein